MKLQFLNVNTQKEKQFASKGIFTTEDLIHYYPRKYLNCSEVTDLVDGEFCVLEVIVEDVEMFDEANTPYFVAKCRDLYGIQRIKVMWFRKEYLFSTIEKLIGHRVLVAGKYNAYYSTVSEPFLFTEDLSAKKIYPVYSKIRGMSEEYLKEKMKAALKASKGLSDIVPGDIIDELQLRHRLSALTSLHFPRNEEDLNEARKSVIFDDLLYFSLKLEEKGEEKEGVKYFKPATSLPKTKEAVDALPYSLTEDQRKVLRELTERARKGLKINALVQGDVGTGKSIVAYLLMLVMAENGGQGLIMAPTQVLATQHFEELKKIMDPLGFKVAFYNGAKMKKKEKEETLKGLRDGSISFLVGTHSLLDPNLKFKKLAIIITDEEHKFGVTQRSSISDRLQNKVHFVTMSATPIPRSLAEIIYGESTSLHTITTMPAGRKPVTTTQTNKQDTALAKIKEQIKLGHQAYVVCPMITADEDNPDLLSVEEISKEYSKRLPGITTAVVTGKTKKKDLDLIIEDFRSGKIKVLFSTTVIEVGVNVPNATLMVIQNAERFGLAGLHQLRGRVGRGNDQSYCILISQAQNNPRLKAMCSTNDGFVIANEDLKLRGAGELIGERQSGDDKFLSLVLSFPHLFKISKEKAKKLMKEKRGTEVMKKYEEINKGVLKL